MTIQNAIRAAKKEGPNFGRIARKNWEMLTIDLDAAEIRLIVKGNATKLPGVLAKKDLLANDWCVVPRDYRFLCDVPSKEPNAA